MRRCINKFGMCAHMWSRSQWFALLAGSSPSLPPTYLISPLVQNRYVIQGMGGRRSVVEDASCIGITSVQWCEPARQLGARGKRTYINHSWHTYEWVMAHVWTSRGTHMNNSWHIYQWVMAYTGMGNDIHKNEAWRTYECVMCLVVLCSQDLPIACRAPLPLLLKRSMFMCTYGCTYRLTSNYWSRRAP